MTQNIRNKLLQKLLNNRVIGSHKKQKSTVVSWFPSDEQSEAKEVIEEFVRGGEVPLYEYGGGGRNNIHLDNAYDAIEYLYLHDGITITVKTKYKTKYDAVVEDYEGG
jgi:hypothetical protein